MVENGCSSFDIFMESDRRALYRTVQYNSTVHFRIQGQLPAPPFLFPKSKMLFIIR